MRILLSIKPKYANLIIEGVKKYEFRRQIFRKEIEKAYIYCTQPVKKIIGYFYNRYIGLFSITYLKLFLIYDKT